MIARTSKSEGGATHVLLNAARISLKIHGRPCAARPIITPSAPVCASTFNALEAQSMSPFTNTGMLTACLTAATVSYSASPLKKSSRVRPCTASAAIPISSAWRAIETALRLPRLHPVRILSVTGTPAAATTRARIARTSGSSCISAEPAARLQTFLAGQPKLISMIWAPSSTLRMAASAIIPGSPPAICTMRGSGSSRWISRFRDLDVFHSRTSDVTISVAAIAAPMLLQRLRNGRSVTPAIGASASGAARVNGPIFMALQAVRRSRSAHRR